MIKAMNHAESRLKEREGKAIWRERDESDDLIWSLWSLGFQGQETMRSNFPAIQFGTRSTQLEYIAYSSLSSLTLYC